MTPDEKAKELVKIFEAKMNDYLDVSYPYSSVENIPETAKQCALIAVDEILKTFFLPITDGVKNYWQQVKEQIQKL